MKVAQTSVWEQLGETRRSSASSIRLCMPNLGEKHPQRDWATSQLGFGYRLDRCLRSWVVVGQFGEEGLVVLPEQGG